MISVRFSISLLLIATLSPFAWPTLEYEAVWKVTGQGGFSAANTIQYTKETTGIVVCEGDVGIVLFDLKGQRVWEYPMDPPVLAAPAVADVNGDGQEDIVAADGKGHLAVLDVKGKLIWRAELPGGVLSYSCPAVTDLDGDGKNEVLVGDTSGTLSCFDRTGRLLWSFTGDGTQMGPVLVADIYDAPGREIIVTSHDKHIYALTAKGEWIWDLYCHNEVFPNSTPILADVNGDRKPELYIGGGLHHFYQIDLENHRIVLEENVHLHVNSAIAGTDLDGDGKDEIVFGNKGGGVWCFGHEGFRWTREFRYSNLYAAPLFLDLDTDSDLELMLYSKNGEIHFLDSDGSDLFSAKIPCRTNVTPTAGDFDRDGRLDTIATSPGGMEGNSLMCYGTLSVPYTDNPRNHRVFAGNRAHTGQPHPPMSLLPLPEKSDRSSQTGVKAIDRLNLFSGSNTWRFEIDNPDRKRLLFLLELFSPKGVSHRFVRHVHSSRERAVVTFPVNEPGTYKIRRRLIDADDLVVSFDEKSSMDFKGVRSDTDFLHAAFNEIEASIAVWKSTNPAAAQDFNAELFSLKGQLEIQQSRNEDSADSLIRIRHSANRLRSLARSGLVLAASGSFFAWEFNPWAYFDARETLPSPSDRTNRLAVNLCVGEYESLALNLTNITGNTLNVRVVPGDLIGKKTYPAGDHFEFRRALTVPTVRRERVADALPELDRSGILSVPPMESQQLWITVNANGLEPGRYLSTLRLKSVETNPTERIIPIHIEVHNLELPRPRPLRFCLWTYPNGELGTNDDLVLQDLIDHGTTVFFGQSPTAKCDPDGTIVGELDFSTHDKLVKRLSPHGILLFVGSQRSVAGPKFLSDSWRKAYIAYLRRWVSHIKELGLDYTDWALYPYDEPSSPFNETTLNLVKVAQVIREADPNILIYTDPTSGTTKETIRMFTGLIDIWCPSDELLERLPEIVPAAHRVGKELWFYAAAGRAKTLSCLGTYRWRFWYAWNLNMTGVGWWCYGRGNQDPWDGVNPAGNFYHTVYRGQGDVPIASKRWEAAREGIEDYEILYLLRESILAARERGVPAEKIEKAKRLLDELPKQIEAALSDTGRRLPLTPDSVPLYKESTRMLQEAKRQIIKACIQLNTDN